MNRPEELRPPHVCKKVATISNMGKGRDWWLGELIEPFYAPDGVKETHCLHLKTPLKEVWFLCNQGDMQGLTVLTNIPFPVVNDAWRDRMALHYQNAAMPEPQAEGG